jgi:hypothetical protein
MGWPQLFPGKPITNQFGKRILYGVENWHIGRDQPIGAGQPRIAPAAGVVVDVDRTDKYGFYIAVRYDGSPAIERHHQAQGPGRLAVGTRFGAGSVLCFVGRPYLELTEEQRRAKRDWSGGAKWSSTGDHAHQEVRIGGNTEANVTNPAGATATGEWLKVAAQNSAVAAVTVAKLFEEQDDTMKPVLVYIDTPGHPLNGLASFFFQDRVKRTSTEDEIYSLGRAWGVLKPGEKSSWRDHAQRLTAPEYMLAETEINAARTLDRAELVADLAAAVK